jgi:hypothetical protein
MADATGDTPPSGFPPVDPGQAGRGQSPLDAAAAENGDVFSERPELFVAGAFVGGFALAQILKRIGK